MRRTAAVFTALSLVLSLPFCAAAARADTVDDFTLTGGGQTYMFTNPSVLSTLDHPHIVTFYSNGGTWYPFNTFFITVDYAGLELFGFPAISFIAPPPGATPGYDYAQFGVGTYNLHTSAGTPYTLNITAETPSTTPEPGSLLLLVTGAAAAGCKLRRRIL